VEFGTSGRSLTIYFQLLLTAVLGVVLLAAVVLPASTRNPEPLTQPSSDAPSASSSGSAQEVAATTATTPSTPPKEHMLYGWGTSQPTQMRATVRFGATNQLLTPERRQLLADQLVLVRAAAMSTPTVADAEAQGFVRNFQRVNGRGFEYINWSRFKNTLDLAHPTLLAFEDDKPDSKVISVAYNVLGTIEAGPPKGLPLEVIPWHYHSNLCKKGDSIIGNSEFDENGNLYPEQAARCAAEGAVNQPQLNHWMVDLWVIPGWENPWGLVSSKHPDLMFEPTPWFTSDQTGQDGLGLYCHIGQTTDAIPAVTPAS